MSNENTNEITPPAFKPVRKRLGWVSILGAFLLLALAILGGYQSGLGVRRDAYGTQIVKQLDEQFWLGVQDFNAGNYEIALGRFTYVIEKNPTYPGAQEMLTETLVKMSITPTPTVPPTATLTPTPDVRGVEAMINSARALLNAQDWNGALGVLDALRKENPAYRTAEVDGMYYIALRMRGMGKFQAQSCRDINLEGGIYDLTLAERFGPLDYIADGYRTWSRLYIIGASFWEVDWGQVQNYFGQIYPNLPNLMDASCISATERFRVATIHVGDMYYADKKWCKAVEQYDTASNLTSGTSTVVIPKANYEEAYWRCYPPTSTPEYIEIPTDTPVGP